MVLFEKTEHPAITGVADFFEVPSEIFNNLSSLQIHSGNWDASKKCKSYKYFQYTL